VRLAAYRRPCASEANLKRNGWLCKVRWRDAKVRRRTSHFASASTSAISLLKAVIFLETASISRRGSRMNASRGVCSYPTTLIGRCGGRQHLRSTISASARSRTLTGPFGFIPCVRLWHRRLQASGRQQNPRSPFCFPIGPSIAVLPFSNMSGDPEQEYFADGMVEDILTALSRFKSLFVIARNSSFTYKGKAVDIKQVGRELGVRYVLEGSVRKAGGRMRITGQLIEAVTGAHLWADKIDGALEDVFDLQDEVTTRVVGAIEPSITRAEITRAQVKSTFSLDAYDLYLRALAAHYSQTRADIDKALLLLEEALRLDASYAWVKAFAAYIANGGSFFRRS
jgi:TolB-like protein